MKRKIVSIMAAAWIIVMAMCHSASAVTPAPLRDSGRATWYGNGNHHGSVRADGKPFDPNEPLFAHRWIRLGTYVLVVNTETGKSLCAPVLDRGPYGALYQGEWVLKKKPSDLGTWKSVIDMSAGAAVLLHDEQELDTIPNANVTIHFLKNGGKTPENCYRERIAVDEYIEALMDRVRRPIVYMILFTLAMRYPDDVR